MSTTLDVSIDKMNISDDDNNITDGTATNKDNELSVCANCGKGGSSNEIDNVCNKCKQVKYCNAACKKKHRHKHKKECDRRIAELHDKELFRQPPPKEDCPICFIRLPTLITGYKFQSCCGKMICSGCIHAPVYDDQGNKVDNKKCPFCRIPTPYTNDEIRERLKKRMEAGDAHAMHNLGIYFSCGEGGLPQDYKKAIELFRRSAELGDAVAYSSIGYVYYHGRGVEIDMKKAYYYYELAAIGGIVQARHNLGLMEGRAGNNERALKHWTIAVRDGESKSLKQIKVLYLNGHATKEDYTKALQLYQEYLVEIKSVQRDEAAVAAYERYRYY